jgi:hypothetical protein
MGSATHHSNSHQIPLPPFRRARHLIVNPSFLRKHSTDDDPDQVCIPYLVDQRNLKAVSNKLTCCLSEFATMGKTKNTRKFAVAKKMISPKDTRVKENLEKAKKKEADLKKKEEPRQIEQAHSSLFFQYNTQLGPPYHVLVDTNFINFSIRYVWGY